MGTYFHNGTIWCGYRSYANSLRIDQALIVELDGAPASNDQIVDLDGGFLSPTFIDGHAHPLFAGREAQGPQVNGLQTVAEIVNEVRRFAEENPTAPWIIGGAYEASIIERGDFLTTWLDDAVNDRPVVLQAVDHHTIWVNSKALTIAGITSATPDPAGGGIARNHDGSPRGTLREPSAIELVMKHMPPRTIDDDVAAIKWASDRYLECGVTAATDAWVEPGMAEAYREAEKSGQLGIDINLFLLAQPDSWRDRIEYFKEIRAQVEGLGESSQLKARTIKIICDGALSSGTAALLEPYLDDPSSTGLLIWRDEELLEAALIFDRLGFQLHMHAIGDAAVRQALNTIKKVKEINPHWDRRPVIAHAQLIHPSDLPSFKTLDVIANYQPLWSYLDPMNKELIAPRIGELRNNNQYQLASMVKTGARISYGSDWPVTSQIPLMALGVPTHRQPPTGDSAPWSPEESISVEESLSFYTYGAAYQNYDDERCGQLKLGMAANLLHLEHNPLDIDPLKIPSIRIINTYKDGIAL